MAEVTLARCSLRGVARVPFLCGSVVLGPLGSAEAPARGGPSLLPPLTL